MPKRVTKKSAVKVNDLYEDPHIEVKKYTKFESKSIRLFDALFKDDASHARAPFSDVRNTVKQTHITKTHDGDDHDTDYAPKRKSPRKCDKNKRKNVMFLIPSSNESESQTPKPKPKRKPKPQIPLKDKVYEAYCKSDLPDFDAFPPLCVVKANPFETRSYKPNPQPTPDIHKIMSPFKDLIPRFGIKMNEEHDFESTNLNQMNRKSLIHENTMNDVYGNGENECLPIIDTSSRGSSVHHSSISRHIPLKEKLVSAGLGDERAESTPHNIRKCKQNITILHNLSPVPALDSPQSPSDDMTMIPKASSVQNMPKVSDVKLPVRLEVVEPEEFATINSISIDESNPQPLRQSNDASFHKHRSRTLLDINSKSVSKLTNFSNTLIGPKEPRLTGRGRNDSSQCMTGDFTSFIPKSTVYGSSHTSTSTLRNSKNSHSSMPYMLCVNNKLDTPIQQFLGHQSPNRQNPTTQIITVFDDDTSIKCRNRHSLLLKNPTPYQYYKKSIAVGYSYCKLQHRSRISVVSSRTSSRTARSVITKSLVNRDDFKHHMNSISFNESKVIDAYGDEHIITVKEKTLAHCEPQQIVTFNDAISACVLKKCKKIGEGCYGEVYGSKDETGKDIILKIISIPHCDDEEEQFFKILPDLVVSRMVSHLQYGSTNRTPNFINMSRASCVRGKFPQNLIDEWNIYADRKGTENDDPEDFDDNQLYIVMQLSNGGTDMERYVFYSAVQSLSIFIQIAYSLASAEMEYEFEHRDLHWGNVLIAKTPRDTLTYLINGNEQTIKSNGVIASIIDFSLSRIKVENYIVFDDLNKYDDLFTGVGDYQFDIYRLMRTHNGGDWEKFKPHSNILWLHYTADKLINKKYKSTAKLHCVALETLKQLKDEILQYSSAHQLVYGKIFSDIKCKCLM